MTDYNPITTPNTVLTDALNATYITYNGNEMMIQNDMGNTLIQDTTTGNLMGLSTGFLPVGMKEHGGILYIASYNPKTNQSELGTIPSPLFNYTYDTDPETTFFTSSTTGSIINIKLENNSSYNLLDLEPTNKIQISNYSFHVGEQFMVQLDFVENNKITRYVLFDEDTTPTQIDFPLISGYKIDDSVPAKEYGLYDLKLFAGVKKSNLGLFPMDYVNNSAQEYYTTTNTEEKSYASNWFLSASDVFNVERCYSTVVGNANATQNTYRTYPNIPYGNLFIQAVINENEECQFVENVSTYTNSPYYVIVEVQIPETTK